MFSEYRLRNGTVLIGETLAFTSIATAAKFVKAAFALRPDVATPPVAGGGAGRGRGRGAGTEFCNPGSQGSALPPRLHCSGV